MQGPASGCTASAMLLWYRVAGYIESAIILLYKVINISILCGIVCRIGSERAACIAVAAAVGLLGSSRLTGCPSRCYYTDVHGQSVYLLRSRSTS